MIKIFKKKEKSGRGRRGEERTEVWIPAKYRTWLCLKFTQIPADFTFATYIRFWPWNGRITIQTAKYHRRASLSDQKCCSFEFGFARLVRWKESMRSSHMSWWRRAQAKPRYVSGLLGHDMEQHTLCCGKDSSCSGENMELGGNQPLT